MFMVFLRHYTGLNVLGNAWCNTLNCRYVSLS